jgi:hypothetical protein
MITAMTELMMISLLLLLAVATVLATLREVHGDGYGHRPPPTSHPRDLFDPVAGRRLS